MKDITAKELKERFTLKQLQAYNSEIRSKYNEMIFNYRKLEKQFEARVKTDVKRRTKELEKNYNNQLKEKDKKLKEKDKLIEEKDKQIDALKEKIARMESKMNNDASNSGIPTSKTPIGKKKHI